MADPYPLPLARLLSAATQLAVRDLNTTLTERGYPDPRPADGYALLAVGVSGATASQLGARLGVTKQAAAKIAARLEQAGYLVRADHPDDGRAQLLQRSPRGEALLQDAATVQRDIERQWARTIGKEHMAHLRSALEALLDRSGEDRPLARLW